MKKKTILNIMLVIIVIIGLILLKLEKNNLLKNDYYTYVNKEKLAKKLKRNEYNISSFSIVQDKVDKQTDKIINTLLKEHKNENMNILYNQLINDETKNSDNKEIFQYLEKIDSSQNLNEFIANATEIENTLQIDIFTNIKIDNDMKDNQNNIVYFYPITYDFGANSDYYINDDYMSYKALIKQYGIKLLKEYGYSKAKSRIISNDITNMYIDISKKSKLSSNLQEISNYYHLISQDELQDIYSNLNIQEYLKSKKIPLDTKISIVDIGNYKAMNSYLKEENLDLLKESVKLKILENYAIYLSKNYANLIYELNNKLSGSKESLDTKTRAYNILKNVFNYDINLSYSQKYLTSKEKKEIENLINDILITYNKNISSLNWLSAKTKKEAQNKLTKMSINVGTIKEQKDNPTDYKLDDNYSLIKNILLIKAKQKEHEIYRLEHNIDENLLPEFTVNAYYNPSDNSINFPTATINLLNNNDSYYQKLGSIGMIIAHEITHAFDSNGSKFDSNGNLENWWTNVDKKNYKKLEKEVINYYNNYEVIDGEYINGTKTLNENIADLGAISCITNLATTKKATNEELSQMYKSFAKLWYSKSTDEYQKLLLLEDNHAPAKYRVNATLSSTNAFYKVYKINIFDNMYISPKKRLKVW